MPKTITQAQILAEEIKELEVAIATDELDWQANYQPHAERYRAGFKVPSPEQKKQERVEALQADIASREMHLQRAQLWLSKREDDRPYYPGGDALREATYLAQAIPQLERQLAALVAEPVAQDKEYEAKFRSYVKARVAVQPALEQFLEAQQKYLAALAEFKLAIASNPMAAEFPAAALGQPRVVSAEASVRLV